MWEVGSGTYLGPLKKLCTLLNFKNSQANFCLFEYRQWGHPLNEWIKSLSLFRSLSLCFPLRLQLPVVVWFLRQPLNAYLKKGCKQLEIWIEPPFSCHIHNCSSQFSISCQGWPLRSFKDATQNMLCKYSDIREEIKMDVQPPMYCPHSMDKLNIK